MLNLELVPRIALQNDSFSFTLGMPLSLAIACIQRCNYIKNVELVYSDQQPFSQPIKVVLTDDGISLSFDSTSQRLKIIEVVDFTKLVLNYDGISFSTPQDLPNLAKVQQVMGATTPGTYDSTTQTYTLTWSGVAFTFLVDSVLQSQASTTGLGSLQFAPNTPPPLLNKLYIFDGNSLPDAVTPARPIATLGGNVAAECVEITRKSSQAKSEFSMSLGLMSEEFQRNGVLKMGRLTRAVAFGDCTQDVIGALGAPSQVFYKNKDKMKIHANPPRDQHAQPLRSVERTDYFFNYFGLGLDVMFDADTNRVKKFVLRSNFPGHYDFSIYDRCPLRVRSNLFEPTLDDSGDPGSHRARSNSGKILNFGNKWSEWRQILDMPEKMDPVVLNRDGGDPSLTFGSPFSSTLCYGFRDIIFEVMSNDYIASITFCQFPAASA